MELFQVKGGLPEATLIRSTKGGIAVNLSYFIKLAFPDVSTLRAECPRP